MSWPIAALADVAELQREGIAPENIQSGTRYLGLEHIESGGNIIGGDPIENGELASTKFSFNADNVLYGKLRPYLAKIALPEFEGVCSTDILPIKPSERLDRRFLAYFLRQPSMVDYANSRSTGANLPRLSPKALAEFEIPLPPLSEQKRIAGILDEAARLCRLRARALEKLNSLGQAIFQEMFGDLVGNERQWRTQQISAVCHAMVDCVNRTAPVVDGPTDFRMIRTTNVRHGRVNLESVRFVDAETFLRWNRRLTPEPGDVLLTREAPVGEVGVLKESGVFLGQRLFLYRPDTELMTSEFLSFQMRSNYFAQQFEQYGSGSTVKHLPLPACQGFEVRVPPIKQQREFSDRFAECESMLSAMQAKAQGFNRLAASLQHRAFRGEL